MCSGVLLVTTAVWVNNGISTFSKDKRKMKIVCVSRCVSAFACARVCMYVCMYVCMNVCVCVCVCVCTRARERLCVCVCVGGVRA